MRPMEKKKKHYANIPFGWSYVSITTNVLALPYMKVYSEQIALWLFLSKAH